MKKLVYFLTIAGFIALPATAQRSEQLLEKGWLFTKGDNTAFAATTADDYNWQHVTVPHDWAIYGPFSYMNDRQNVAISQDGQKAAMEHAGRTGGLPFVGTGWYRLHLNIPDFKEGRRAELIFDGAMSHPQVYVNGSLAGQWADGYNSFIVDITPYVKAGAENVVAVRLENLTESSRWYPGAGLYRNVHLRVTDAANIPTWGVQITTPQVSTTSASVNVTTQVATPATKGNYRLVSILCDANGKELQQDEISLRSATDTTSIQQSFIIKNPRLWSVETPELYTLKSELYDGNRLCDSNTQRFGVRSIELINGKGFALNGKITQFRGVCNHHDLGPLGAAVNVSAIRRQIRLLKDMGCNAIRTSHNMPAPELVEACDEMGMMLMCESFDEWTSAKCANGYNRDFDRWVERDLVNLVRHYRNNPSVVMWSIGNEVPDQWSGEKGTRMARRLQAICHREDATRPVTQGMDAPDAVMQSGMAAAMDVPGFNYRPFKYEQNVGKLPQRFLLGTETASTLSSRGVYKFPVERASMRKYDDHQASSYDVEHCGWSDLPEDNFIWHEDRSWSMGEFVWTGFDYLGEPTPYYSDWPSHSSLFGIIDLAGIPKDRFYLYRSHWNPTAQTLHVLPHWTWSGREGKVTPVFAYTNYPTAELFINGKSQGRISKDTTVEASNSGDNASNKALKRCTRYRLMWRNAVYEPGEIKVVAYDKNGRAAATQVVCTAGAPARLEILPETNAPAVKADGKDIAFLRVRMVDAQGNLCPMDSSLVNFKVEGAGTYRAAANGNPACLDLFHQPQMHLFSGELTLLVQSDEKPGNITVTATADGVKAATYRFETK